MKLISWISQAILVIMFLPSAYGKLTNSRLHRKVFDHLRLPQWFRVVTGVVESIGSIFLLLGYWQEQFALIGAIIIGMVAIGGTLAHARVGDGVRETFMIVFLGFVTLVLLLALI